MIFITVGTQLAFDRLVTAVDRWVVGAKPGPVFAQVGPSAASFTNLEYKAFVPPDQADALFRGADIVVSHAGMGSILTALKYRKPIVIMPRRAALGEHRNDHQLATAKWLGGRSGITVAWDESELVEILDRHGQLAGGEGISDRASDALISRLRTFIQDA